MGIKRLNRRTGLTFFTLAMLCVAQSFQPALAERVKDSCIAEIPKPLAKILEDKFKGFRLPMISDQSREDVSLFKKYGNDGCFTVAIGDFTGNHRKSYAILLTNEELTKVKLVAALSDEVSWSVYELPTWCSATLRCYVRVQRSGSYHRSDSLSAPISDPNERDVISSRYDAILAGTLEATGVVYVFQNGSWQYVWVSD